MLFILLITAVLGDLVPLAETPAPVNTETLISPKIIRKTGNLFTVIQILSLICIIDAIKKDKPDERVTDQPKLGKDFNLVLKLIFH